MANDNRTLNLVEILEYQNTDLQDIDVTDIFIEPPDPNVNSDQDSADEDEGGTIEKLTYSMDPTIPDWITADFLRQSLQSDDRYKDIVLSDFKASLAAPAGNNYGGLVVRVIVDCKLRGEEKKVSVIVKGPVTEGAMAELSKELKNCEPLFYNVFLPEVKKLLEYVFAPITFDSPISSVVVMEDLKETGYMMADRFKQLDFEHCCLYATAASAFHAASVALHKYNPEIINSVCGQNVYVDESKARQFTGQFNKWALECMASHITDKRISEIVRDSAKYIIRMLEEIHRPNEYLNTLLQGDPWTTNMMFKYDGQGKVSGIKLIDFQNLFLGSPVHDLVFFIWSSANDEVRKHRLRDLYSHYVRCLNKNLRELNYQEFNFDCFMETIRMFSPLTLATSACSALPLSASPGDVNEIIAKALEENPGAGSNPMERLFTEHFCQTKLPQLVEHLAAEGVFDFLETKLKSMSDDSS